ncbi:hypothetical protein ACWPKO_17355 [Coraliomargarita sp. W4R53]
MAGEKKGKAYEAFVKLVLDELKIAKLFRGRIFWEEKPDAMTIKPDFTIGRSKNAPSQVLMVSHGGSAKESNRKYWRNVGELVEEKLLLSTTPLVFSVFFDAVIKEDIKKVASQTFDAELIVGDRPYGDALQCWVEANLKTFPKDQDAKVDHLRTLRSTDKVLDGLCVSLKADIDALLRKSAPKVLDAIWAQERARTKGVAPARKETFARRGLSKLLVFEDIDMALRLYSGKAVKLTEVPAYAYELGLATKAIGRAKPADCECVNAVKTLGAPAAKRILKKAPIDKIEGWLLTLRNSSHIAFMGKYVVANYTDLCDPVKLEKQLLALHKSPSALIKGMVLPVNWPPQTVWLFDLLLEVIKLSAGNPTAYGLAQLEKDVSALPSMPAVGDPVYRTRIPGWSHRRAKVVLPKLVLKGIALVLSGHLRRIGTGSITKLLSGANVAKYLEGIVEVKLCTYRGFDPLADLINHVCSAKKMPTRSCFGEKAELTGAASKTAVLQSKSTLINWQSCSDAGRDHKKKELCGRAVALRYSWDATAKKFIPRPGVKKLILLVDGTWRQSDLDALVRSGWDEIFYPDQMAELAKAIV